MKNIFKQVHSFRFIIVVFCLFTITNPLNAQWIQTSSGLTNNNVFALAVSGTNIFAGVSGGVYLSTNNGTSWTAVNNGLTTSNVRALAVSGTNLFAGTFGGGVFLSTNDGTSWTEVNNGLTNFAVFSLAVSGTNLFTGTQGGGVFLSTNNGISWSEVNVGLPAGTIAGALAVSGTNLFAGSANGGAFLSTNNGTTWTTINSGLTNTSVQALAVSGTNIFAGTFGGGVFRTTDNGTNWTAASAGFINSYVKAFAVSDTNIFAGTIFGSGVFLSTNNGTSWNAVNTGMTNNYVYALSVLDTNLFAGTQGGGVWRRPLSEFTSIAQAPQYYNYNTIAETNSFPFNIDIGKQIQLLYLAGDFNQPTPAPAGNITSLSFIMAENLGPYTYTDMVIKMGQADINIFNPGVWYTGQLDTFYYRASVIHSGIAGQWLTIQLDRPFAYNPAQGLIVDVKQCGALGATGFSCATTTTSGFRKNYSMDFTSCPFVVNGQQGVRVNNIGFSYGPVGIQNINNEIPDNFKLEQNYPNPFNPVTNLEFGISKLGFVSLKVYDVIGKEVAILVNENLAPGIYKVEFDGSNLTSGVYFYRIETGSFTETKRMLLIK